MARALALLSVACTAFAIDQQDLENWLSSQSGLDLSRDTAHDLANRTAAIFTLSNVALDALQSLRDTLYSPSGLDFSKADLQAQLIPLAEQHVSPDSLKTMFGVLHPPSGAILPKEDAQVAALDLVRSFAEADQVKALYSVLTTGHDCVIELSAQEQQNYTILFAKCGADPDTLNKACGGHSDLAFKGIPVPNGTRFIDILNKCADAVSANLNGLAKRFARDGKAYNATEFQSYFTKWQPFGMPEWMTEWLAAPQEKRLAPDGQEYTASEFREYFGASWVSRYSSAAPSTQLRIAEDGVAYNLQQFVDYYKQSWQQKWNDAPVMLCKECRPQVRDTALLA